MMAPPPAIVGILSCLVQSRLACFLAGFASGFALCLGSITVVERRKHHQVFVAEIPSLDTVSMAPTLRPRPRPSHDNGDDETAPSKEDSPPPSPPPRSVDAEPHPTRGFRVVRCTIGLVNPHTMALDTQNIELCFHDDFVASEDRPLSLHLDHRHLSMYDIPPLLTAPPPPGAIFDLGRVDVIPDDPELVILLERQIRRELAEEMQRRAPETQSIRQRAMHLTHVGGNFVEANRGHIVTILRLLLGVLVLTLIQYAYLSETSEPTTSPVPLVPLVNYITSAVLDTTQLTPIIFFSPFFSPTITNGSINSTDNPEEVISKSYILDQTWHMTEHLCWDFLHKRFSAEEFRRYTASDQSFTARHRLLKPGLWEYAGIRWRNVSETWARGNKLYTKARWEWPSLAVDVFVAWTRDMEFFIRPAAAYLEYVDVTSASSMFIAPETGSPNATTCPGNLIARAALPKEIPPEVRDILDAYRDYMARRNFLSLSCEFLQDCAAPLPDSASSHQVVHPSCQLCRAGDCSSEAMIKNLEEWSATARARNLPWSDLAGFHRPRAETRMAEYFWPNKTEVPLLFNQAMMLAQLKDVMSQVVETVEVVKHADQKIQDKGIFARIKDRVQCEPVLPDPEGDMKQLKEMLQVRFWHQLRDAVQGVQAVSGICDELSTLSSLVNKLYSPANWIIEEGKSTVMLQKMAHPKDQAKALKNLLSEMDRRLGVLDGYYQLWAQAEKKQDEKDLAEWWSGE